MRPRGNGWSHLVVSARLHAHSPGHTANQVFSIARFSAVPVSRGLT
jgi:hypothetical protein